MVRTDGLSAVAWHQFCLPSRTPLSPAVRDYRRNSKYTARTVASKEPFDFDKVRVQEACQHACTCTHPMPHDMLHAHAQMYASAPVKPEDIKEVPRPEMMTHRGY